MVEVPYASVVRTAALLVLVAHALEVPVAFKFGKRYDGPLGVSVALTLLFGFLHWIPLARQQRARRTDPSMAALPAAAAFAYLRRPP